MTHYDTFNGDVGGGLCNLVQLRLQQPALTHNPSDGGHTVTASALRNPTRLAPINCAGRFQLAAAAKPPSASTPCRRRK